MRDSGWPRRTTGQSNGNGVQIPREVRYLEIYEQLANDIDPDRSVLDEKLRGLELTISRGCRQKSLLQIITARSWQMAKYDAVLLA